MSVRERMETKGGGYRGDCSRVVAERKGRAVAN